MFSIKNQDEKLNLHEQLFVCLFQWTPSFKEGGEYPLDWDLAHVLRPNRPHYHLKAG